MSGDKGKAGEKKKETSFYRSAEFITCVGVCGRANCY
jgi:hypothetical protein